MALLKALHSHRKGHLNQMVLVEFSCRVELDLRALALSVSVKACVLTPCNAMTWLKPY